MLNIRFLTDSTLGSSEPLTNSQKITEVLLVIEYPKKALVVLLLLMLTSFGASARSMIEMAILYPMIKFADGQSKIFLSCSIVFAVGLLVSLTISWINGVSGFNVWNWLASIGFTMFAFETFYAFLGASVRIYNTDNEIQ